MIIRRGPQKRGESKLMGGVPEIENDAENEIKNILPKEKPDRYSFVWNGVTVSRRASRCPRILHLEASKPRGSKINQTGSW